MASSVLFLMTAVSIAHGFAPVSVTATRNYCGRSYSIAQMNLPHRGVASQPRHRPPQASSAAAPIIGSVMAVGSAVKGLPQIVRIFRARSTSGLAPAALYGDMLVFATKVCYHSRMHYPLSAWSELLFLLAQNLVCISLRHCFDAGSLRQRWLFAAADVVIGACVVGVLIALPRTLLPWLSLSTAPLLLCSYSAQISTNIRRKSTGQLAPLTVLLRGAGSLVRVGTTLTQLGGDPAVLGNHCIGAIGSTILLVQIGWYKTEGALRSVQAVRAARDYERLPNAAVKAAQTVLLWRSLGGFDPETQISDAQLHAAFNAIDTDGSGSITRNELAEAVMRSAPTDLDEVVEMLLAGADRDGSQTVDFEEYLAIMTHGERICS
uniref:EF-hand domain-containing protein n=1 Tax=Coccolithus braarudii TaxID=221442 RepID=A0A7S0LPZ0_9EUKA|mmetsp:Transcript_49444/g.105578  ORF Transcript_49444/g.105578 Transcript_49444/m.105578 type:complete len:378 (+) Transcript_49444:12-1145(+)